MAASVFDNKSIKPAADALETALGKSAKFWKEIKRHLQERYGELTEEWKFYNQKSGWILKVLRKKRNLFFFTPLKNHFRIAFVFGDKAVAAIEQSDLPNEIIHTLKNARKYAEGRGILIDVKSPGDVENVKKLVDIKVSN